MARQITSAMKSPSDYLDRLFQIIPAEVTAAYIAVQTLLADAQQPEANAMLLYGFGAFLTILIPLYLWRLQNINNLWQIVVSTISFPIWAANISVATVVVTFRQVTPELLAVVMIGWVLVTPLLVPAKP